MDGARDKIASAIEHKGGRYEKAVELARESIAADARLPAETLGAIRRFRSRGGAFSGAIPFG